MSMLIAGARDAELSVRVCPGREQVMSVKDEDVYSCTVNIVLRVHTQTGYQTKIARFGTTLRCAGRTKV